MNKAKPIDDEALAEPGLDGQAIEAIGRALRAHYKDLVTAPLPERFNELLAKLGADDDEPTAKGGANASG